MATMTIESLAWDSAFLGYGVARLVLPAQASPELAPLVAQARAAGVRLLYLVVAPEDAAGNAAAQQAGAVLMDRKLTFAMPVDAAEARQAVDEAIHPTQAATEGLEALALQSGEYSRFRLDPQFAPDTYEALYRQWLHNSLAGTLAREVLVYQSAAEAAAGAAELGLLTLGLKNGRADIGLLAVAQASRGRGVGQALVQAARQRTAAWGLAELQVVTQGDNLPACSFYRRCGFHKIHLEHIYHLWLTE